MVRLQQQKMWNSLSLLVLSVLFFYPLSLVSVVIWKVYITNEFTNNTSLTIYLILVVHTEFLGPVRCFSIRLMADLNTRPSKSIVYAVIKLSWAMGLDQSA